MRLSASPVVRTRKSGTVAPVLLSTQTSPGVWSEWTKSVSWPGTFVADGATHGLERMLGFGADEQCHIGVTQQHGVGIEGGEMAILPVLVVGIDQGVAVEIAKVLELGLTQVVAQHLLEIGQIKSQRIVPLLTRDAGTGVIGDGGDGG